MDIDILELSIGFLTTKDEYSMYRVCKWINEYIEDHGKYSKLKRAMQRGQRCWRVCGEYYVYVSMKLMKPRIWKIGRIDDSAKDLFNHAGCVEFVRALRSKMPDVLYACLCNDGEVYRWVCWYQGDTYDIKGKNTNNDGFAVSYGLDGLGEDECELQDYNKDLYECALTIMEEYIDKTF